MDDDVYRCCFEDATEMMVFLSSFLRWSREESVLIPTTTSTASVLPTAVSTRASADMLTRVSTT